MLMVFVKRLRYCANGGFDNGRTHSFYHTSFDITYMAKAFTHGVKVFSPSNMFMLNEAIVVVD